MNDIIETIARKWLLNQKQNMPVVFFQKLSILYRYHIFSKTKYLQVLLFSNISCIILHFLQDKLKRIFFLLLNKLVGTFCFLSNDRAFVLIFCLLMYIFYCKAKMCIFHKKTSEISNDI